MPNTSYDAGQNNINYINKDFESLKTSLIEYAQTYFPNTYKDFNETSPGMMLIEMSAYVGDVLSFYIDQQYREMLLPLSEEKRNVIAISSMLGYKVKPVTSAYVSLKVSQEIDADTSTTDRAPIYSQAISIDKGFKISSESDSNIKFETIDIADFTISGSSEYGVSSPVSSDFDSDGIVTKWMLTRKVRAISGETKQHSFTVGAPVKFLALTIDDTEVTEIIDVTDSNGNRWYEVDYLAQDKVPIETHYSADSARQNDYTTNTDGSLLDPVVSVPFSLSFITTGKRFITKVNDNDTTSLIFGNGILKTGQTWGENFLETDQAGITVPGTQDSIMRSIDPIIGNDYSTLGESPAHTTLTVKYRSGGGASFNVSSGDLTSYDSVTTIPAGETGTITVTNDEPARGGSSQQSVDEIRERALGFFATQNRCVTKEDYEARVLAMPAKFGSIAKVYVNRADPYIYTGQSAEDFQKLKDIAVTWIAAAMADDSTNPNLVTEYNAGLFNFTGTTHDANEDDIAYINDNINLPDTADSAALPTVEIWTLSYDDNKNLTALSPTHLINKNLKNYISNFRIITDEIVLSQGYIINFGVYFDIVGELYANKQEVKLNCIKKIIDYFDISKMQFKQPIYVSQLEYELMSVKGVRAVNYVTISQNWDYNMPGYDSDQGDLLFGDSHLWTTEFQPLAFGEAGGWIENTETGQAGYGYRFDFGNSLINGEVRPAVTPSIFELKNPNQNVKGRVR